MAETLLAILLTLVVVCGNSADNGVSCPLGCVCITATTASCRDIGIDGIRRLPAATWSLDVVNSTTPDVIVDIASAKLPGLTELSLTNCHIRELRSGNFVGLERVSRLNLSSNFLKRLQHGVFAPLSSLQVLNLSWNLISEVSSRWLKGLASLQVLDLSCNNIETLEDSAFADVSSLQRLDLSGNHLAVVSASSFNGFNSSLQWLDLSLNRIVHLNDSVFGALQNLQVLKLGGNVIKMLSGQCFSGLSNLQQMDISQNQISVVDDEVFTDLNSLQRFNLSENRIEVLSDQCFFGLMRLQQLDLSSNRICSVSPGTFQSVGGLTELILADNPLLGRMRQELMVLVGTGRRLQKVDASRAGLSQVPAALTRSIRTLQLAGNSVTNVRCGDLDSYPLLQLLDLSDNQIVELEEDALGRLEVLSELNLSGNRLCTVPRSLPSGLTTLQLQNNCIKQLNTSDLQGLPRLKYLSLRNSGIANIQNGALSQLTSLETLDLSENPLTSLPGNALSGPLMTVLRLSFLEEIPSTADAKEMSFPVASPERLEVLELDSSPVLARQLLADTAALAAFRQLRELNLGNDGLIKIRSDLFHFLPRLRTLRLDGNPWGCEDMLWLANWIRQQQKPQQQQLESSLEDAYCASPPHLVSMPVIRLQDADFNTTTTPTSAVSPVAEEVITSDATTEDRYETSISSIQTQVSEGYIEQSMEHFYSTPNELHTNTSPYFAELIETNTEMINFGDVANLNNFSTISTTFQTEDSSYAFRNPSTPTESDEIADNTTNIYDDYVLANTSSTDKTVNKANLKTTQILNTPSVVTESNKYSITSKFANKISLSNTSIINFQTEDDISVTENTSLVTTYGPKIYFINIKLANTSVKDVDTFVTNKNNEFQNSRNIITIMNRNISSKTLKTSVNLNTTNYETNKTIINAPLLSTKNLFGNKSWTQHKFFPNMKNRDFRVSTDPFNQTAISNLNTYKHANFKRNDTVYQKQIFPNKELQKLIHYQDKAYNNIMQGDESMNGHNENRSIVNSNEMEGSVVNKSSNIADKSTNKTNLTSATTEQEESYTNMPTNYSKMQVQNFSNSSVNTNHTTGISTQLHTNKQKLANTDGSVMSEKVSSKHDDATSSVNSTSNKNENGTSLSPNTTSPLEGENLVFENVTLAMGEKSVFYSSRASDAYASGVRVTVKENASTSLISGSHPGMFVLVAVGLAMAGALAVAMSHCAKRRRRLAVEYSRQQDIEVRSMSSIGDLW